VPSDFTGVLAAVDLNGDGIPDIVAQSGEGLVVLLGQTGLQFSPPTHYAFSEPIGYNPGTDSTLIADYNKDGNLDVATFGANGIYITYGAMMGPLTLNPSCNPPSSIAS
jgi:hypothetical protein